MTDKKEPNFINAKRRGFLQGAAVASGAVASGAAVSAEILEPVADVVQSPKGHKGYEVNEYRQRYYARARN